MLDKNYQKVIHELQNWIRDKVEAAGCQGAVIGLSGVMLNWWLESLVLIMRQSILIIHLRNSLVIGTDNRSELKLGYFTKYGDGGIDLAPLGGLVKTEVREIARILDIPEEIITKPPSAGLWEGQTDEQELGISYEELDRYILTGAAPEEVKETVDQLAQKNQHKLEMPDIFQP